MLAHWNDQEGNEGNPRCMWQIHRRQNDAPNETACVHFISIPREISDQIRFDLFCSLSICFLKLIRASVKLFARPYYCADLLSCSLQLSFIRSIQMESVLFAVANEIVFVLFLWFLFSVFLFVFNVVEVLDSVINLPQLLRFGDPLAKYIVIL